MLTRPETHRRQREAVPKDNRTRRELLLQIEELQTRLTEAQDTLKAIHSGEVDAIVVSGAKGEQVFTLKGADQPYRALVETMNEGTVTLLAEGTVAYSNNRFAEMIGTGLEEVIGSPFVRFLSPGQQASLESLLKRAAKEGSKAEARLLAANGSTVPVQLSAQAVEETGGFCLVITDLSEQKRGERDRAFLAGIVDCSDDAIIGKTLDGTILSWNRGAERLYGYSAEEVVGRSVSLLLSPQHPDELSVILERIKRGEHVEHYETERVRKDGEHVPVTVTVSPIRDSEGHVVAASSIVRDITEHKRAEEALRKSAERERARAKELEAVLDAVPVPVFISHDSECKVMTGNRAAFDLTRLPPGSNPSKSAPDSKWPIYRASDGSEIPAEDLPMQRAAATGRAVFDAHFTLEFEDGSERHVWGNAAPLFDPEGKPCGVVGGFLDITEPKQAEEVLKEREEKYRALIETTVTGYVIVDVGGRVLDANPEYIRLTGHAGLPEILGHHVMEWTAPTDVARNAEAVRDCVERGFIRGFEIEYIDKDGKCTPIEINATLVPTAGGPQILTLCRDITERKRAEQALRRASAYNRSLIEASLDPLVTIAPDGKITDVNATTEKVTGHSRQELIGTDFSDYFTEPDKARAGYQQMFRQGWVQDYELEIRHRDGHTTPVLYNASVYRDENGETAGVFAAARDITERKRSEETRARLAAIIESSDDAIIAKTLDGVIQSWNRGAEHLYGYSAQEAVGRPVNILLSPDRPDELPSILERIKRGERVIHYETERMRKDGELVPVSVGVSPIRDAAGRVIGASSIARDITERRRAEEALRRASAYNRSLIEASLDPLVTIATDGKITDVNEATVKVSGVPRQELIDTDFSDYFTDPGKARTGYQKVFEEGWVQDYELEIRHRDGHTTPVLYNASVYRDQKGEVTGVFAAARDITKRKQAEEEIRQLNASLERRVAERTAQLAAANKELEAFTYSVAHDLRGPLRGMEGFSLALLEDYGDKLDEQGRNYAERVRAATLRMAQLIDDLLNLSRISRAEVRKRGVDVSAMAQAIASDLQKSDPERPVELVIQPSLEAEADPQLLRVAIENLLGNAWKFSAQRRPARIEFGVTESDGHKAFFVRDNGAGFDMAYAGKLFAPFQRLHSASEFPGTGIGLATVARIVRKHGGEVRAEGEVGKGATFYFTLGKVPVESRESKVES